MDIRILHLVEGARNAVGVTVVIDVFRAFSMEAYLFSKGVKKIIPVGDSGIAYRLKNENPDMILAGERHGKILPGFDIGNSPSELMKIDVSDKTVIHTTSAGTQGIANATNAKEILGGSLVNARATAEYIKAIDPDVVSLVCMGYEAVRPIEEDTLCAEYIKSIIENREFDIIPEIEKLKSTSGAKFFDKNQNDVFPEQDFYLCTDVNKFDFLMKLKRNNDIFYMEKCYQNIMF